MDMLNDRFFEVDWNIMQKVNWVFLQCKIGGAATYMQFLQLIFYFNAHPKMAVLTATIAKAGSEIIHFLMLFGILFCMLSFIAYWQIGTQLSTFATFGDALSGQARMLFGEFIYASGAENLHASDMILYWLYAFTFMLLMFFTLLNFFLAIIVDAFVAVKEEIGELVAVRGFVTDCLLTLRGTFHIKSQWWMPRRDVIAFCEEVIARGKEGDGPKGQKSKVLSEEDDDEEQKKPTFSIADLVAARKEKLEQATATLNEEHVGDSVLAMLAYYHNLCEIFRVKTGMIHMFTGER